MRKSITQDMAYRQSLMKYAEKYGVSRASRPYIYCWKAHWTAYQSLWLSNPGSPTIIPPNTHKQSRS